MNGLLALADPPTAVCCYNDMTALGAMRAIRARGLRVPEDVSVTGFDDLFFAAYLEPPLTTVRQPMRRMGEMAMENLLKLMSGEDSVAQIKVEAELIVRGSTAKANAAMVQGDAMGETGARNGGPAPLTPLSVFCKDTPIIPAIRKPELVEQAIASRSKLIYLLTGDPDNVESMIQKIAGARRRFRW